jgi:hypothetical protein
MKSDKWPMTDDPPDLDIFYGELTATRALIYARLPRPADDTGLSLSGQVRGPRCLHAQTLPLTAPLIDLGAGPTLLARAVIPEPSFWSPDLPSIYDVTIQLRRGTQTIATARREIGLRSLGVRDRHLVLEGKTWVLRGVSSASTTATLPRHWHDNSAVFIMADASLESLDEASQWGALVVVPVAEEGANAVHRLRQLARYPAIAIAILEKLPDDFQKSAVAANVLLAEKMTRQRTTLSNWADVVVLSTEDPDFLLKAAAAIQRPILVSRPLEQPLELQLARLKCDVLQRDLAPIGQFAGYIV